MSIETQIKSLVADGSLAQMTPTLPDVANGRWVFASREILDLFNPRSDQREADRFMRLKLDFDRFMEGGLVSVAKIPRKAKTAFLSCLDPPKFGIWDIRSRDPSPGIRVLGGFAKQDIFIALSWGYRKDLGEYGSDEWNYAIRSCQAHWRRLFLVYEPMKDGRPVTENNIHVYLSNAILV